MTFGQQTVSLPLPSESELVKRLRSRDPELLSAAVREHTRPLYRAARGMGFRDQEAEDLVQDVFTTFLQTLDRFEGRSQLRTWLFGILHRKVMEKRRELFRETQSDPIDDVFESRFDSRGSWVRPPEDLDRMLASQEIGTAIAECLQALPGAQREVFVLREMQDFQTPEICKILGITTTNLSVLMHRARNGLRECIETRGWGKKS